MSVTQAIFGALTVLSACGVIFARRPLNSALSLVVTLFLVAVHFAMMGAQFLATIQIMVYAGAIMVLVIFVIMLLGSEAEGRAVEGRGQYIGVSTYFIVLATCLFVGVLFAVIERGFVFPLGSSVPGGREVRASYSEQSNNEQSHSEQRQIEGSTEAIGQLLFTEYLFPFELASLLLLAAIIGAVLLAQEVRRPLPEGRGLKAKREIPSS